MTELCGEEDIYLYRYISAPWIDWFMYNCPHCPDYAYIFMWEFQFSTHVYALLKQTLGATIATSHHPQEGELQMFEEYIGFRPPLFSKRNDMLPERYSLLSLIQSCANVDELLK